MTFDVTVWGQIMKRIINHWTAGTHTVSATDRKHYHFIIDGHGRVHEGNFKPEDNLDTSTPYAAHTRNLNTGSIGVALAAMHGARERPFKAGKFPITAQQQEALGKLNARLCAQYGIPVRPDTVLTHAEVEPTLGVKQRGKWDINWLPGMHEPKNPTIAGEIIREKTRKYMPVFDAAPEPEPKQSSGLAALISKIIALLTKGFQK